MLSEILQLVMSTVTAVAPLLCLCHPYCSSYVGLAYQTWLYNTYLR